MATDRYGREVKIGDYMRVALLADEPYAADGDSHTVARITAMNESIRRAVRVVDGQECRITETRVSAKGAWIAMEGRGRTSAFSFDPSTAVLVMKSNGDVPAAVDAPTLNEVPTLEMASATKARK